MTFRISPLLVHVGRVSLMALSGLLRLALFGLLSVNVSVAAPPSRPIDINLYAGEYELQSPQCKLQDGKLIDRCGANIKDRLAIVRVDDDNARVVVHSYQINQHVCHVDGVAIRTKGGLKYCLEYEPETCLSFALSPTEITLHMNVDRNHHVPFCGSRATLDGLKFPRTARLDPTRCLKH